MEIEADLLVGLTTLESFSSISNITNDNRNFEFYDNKTDKEENIILNQSKLLDEYEKDSQIKSDEDINEGTVCAEAVFWIELKPNIIRKLKLLKNK